MFPFEGVSFFKKDQRRYVYAATDRFDGYTDKRRSIRKGNFKLIYNGDIKTPAFKPVSYRKQMKTMQVLDSLHKNQELNTYFTNWFSKKKTRFELYNISEDYYETNNLIQHHKYKEIYDNLKYKLFEWMDSSDFGNVSEASMLDEMFSSSMAIPKLNTPKLITSGLGSVIESNNLDASVGWRNKNELIWNIYTTNELIQPKDDFEVLIFKPGYEILIKSFQK